jgi:hypothetical protein
MCWLRLYGLHRARGVKSRLKMRMRSYQTINRYLYLLCCSVVNGNIYSYTIDSRYHNIDYYDVSAYYDGCTILLQNY